MNSKYKFLKLSDVCTFENGDRGKNYPSRTNFVSEGTPFINAGHLENGEISYEGMNFIPEKVFNRLSRGKFFKNDLLFCLRGSLGKYAIAKEGDFGAIASSLVIVRPHKNFLNHNYLGYYFNSSICSKMILKYAGGAAQPNLGAKDLMKFLLPVPPLAEQQEIVRILQQIFATVDQARANVEKNIANTNELYQSKLNEIFSQKGEGWEEKSLNQICSVERGSSPRPIKKFLTTKEEGVHWVKIGDVGEKDKYVTKTAQFITKDGAKKSRFVDVGDLILSNSMSFGRPYIMKIPGYIHDGWFVLRVPEVLNRDYFWEILASPYLKRQFNELAAGAIVKNISGDLVKKAKIPLPPFSEQQKIVYEVEALRNSVQQLIVTFENKLKALEELKESVLQQAFAGELTQKDLKEAAV